MSDKPKKVAKQDYKDDLRAAQIELTKLQRHIIDNQLKVLVLLEGRDAAGKDGLIKSITEHLSPRETRVVALDKPSDRDKRSWYFQRYVAHLPVCGEMALFNRSWYNRAGVERVMGFCTEQEYEDFLVAAPLFEGLLDHCGLKLIKYYLDIDKAEQKKRLQDRAEDPLSQWKRSPIDKVAIKNWDEYSDARDAMLPRTHSLVSPWAIVKADDKHAARIAVIRDLLGRFDYEDKDIPPPDRTIVFPFHDTEALSH